MKKSVFLLMSSLLFCLCLFAYFVCNYYNQQTKLAYESNKLYSKNHVILTGTLDEVLAQQDFKNVPDLRLFVSLERENHIQPRAYYAKSYSGKQFPIKTGSFFTKADSKEAVVGKSIPVIEENQNQYYVYNGKKYRVIGILGMTDPSFLDDFVLLNDKELFPAQPVPLIVDGIGIPASVYEDEQTQQMNLGLDRKINSDFFSPIIYLLSCLVIVISIILIAYVVFLSLKQENYVKYLFGEKRSKKYWSNILLLFKICLLAGCPFVLLLCTKLEIQPFLVELLVFQISLLFLVFSLLFYRSERKMLFGMAR